MNNADDKEMIQQKMKKLLSELPKPKLSEEKRRQLIARVYKVGEERKFIYEPAFVKRFLVISGPAVAFAAVVVMFNFLFSPIYPTVANVKGTVKIYRAAKNEWVFAEAKNIKLHNGDVLKTFSDGQADLIIPDVYHMRLKNDSEIKLARSITRASNGNIGYSLDKGSVFTYYNKQRKLGKELDIETPQATASALGTDFMVESSAMMNQTWVGVLDGTVKVTGITKEALETVMVRAGEKTTIHTKEAPAKPAPFAENELLKMEELYNIGQRPQVALLISTGPSRTKELLSAPILYISSDKTGAIPSKIGAIVNDFNRAIKDRSHDKKDAGGIRQLEEIVNNYPNSKYDVQFLLFIGSFYEYMGEEHKAIETFERVVRGYPKSSMASIAQCAIGIIYEEKLNDPVRAKEAYQKVLSSYPNSPEADEASAGLSRINR